MNDLPGKSGAPPDERRLGARQLARAKRDAAARRARSIRKWVAVLSVTLFIAAFLVVYVQLASGHDPALVTNAERRAAGASRSGTDGTAGSSTEDSGESGSDAGETESSEPSGLSTSQS